MIYIEPIDSSDIPSLVVYFKGLSTQTLSRFGPHRFDLSTLMYLYDAADDHLGFLLKQDDSIIGYSVVRRGYLNHDSERLTQYGLELSGVTDCTFAPSIADSHQGQGLGKKMFDTIKDQLVALGFKRVILWGGVQADNFLAVAYYKKLGFQVLGQFEYHGTNYDMILDL